MIDAQRVTAEAWSQVGDQLTVRTDRLQVEVVDHDGSHVIVRVRPAVADVALVEPFVTVEADGVFRIDLEAQ